MNSKNDQVRSFLCGSLEEVRKVISNDTESDSLLLENAHSQGVEGK